MNSEKLEDTTDIDRELIGNELLGVAQLAGRFNLKELAEEIGALALKAKGKTPEADG